jgi:hypothetical protein
MNAKLVAMGLMFTAMAFADIPENKKVTVCLNPGSALSFELGRARDIAGKIFAKAGVGIDWLPGGTCPKEAIQVEFSQTTPASQFSGALAYALPYEGTHIVVFYDRVQRAVEPKRVVFLLAHVLAHEITHILQGVNQHAPTGVMKAHWEEADYSQMSFQPLPFTPEDVRLIQVGLARRQTQIVARLEAASR